MSALPPRGTKVEDLICKKCGKKRKDKKPKNCNDGNCFNKDKKDK